MKTTLLNINIQGFNKQAQHQSNITIRDYLVGYYEAVEQECVKYKWQIIKTMGDCVFVNSESKLTSETSLHLKYLFEILKLLRVPSSKGFSFAIWLTIHRPILG
jgi:hypothetical protein